MLSLRFLNSSIRAKAVRRGGQPWPAPMRCRPPTARLWPRPTTRGRLAAAKVSPKGRPVAPARGDSRLQCYARKGGWLQGTHKGLPLATSPAASRADSAGRRGGRPLAGWLSVGKGSRHLHRGSSSDSDDTDGARGVRASF
ncbi:hypothetical protein GW17_00055240 [Ensete ventricosum]|nr:hypothetical protein GW17_00055240 [Ensete ventricosum]